MSNLVPTPRTDKNGRTVIRHMKPATFASEDATIPTVSLSTPMERSEADQKEHALTISIAQQTLWEILMEDDPGTLLADQASAAITGYSEATLLRIINFPWGRYSAKDFTSNIAENWTETTANDYMEVTVAMNSLGVSPDHANSWHLYDLHPANNDGDYPGERLSQLVAIVTLIEHMQYGALDFYPYWHDPVTGEVESTYLPQEDLRDLILNPGPYNREDIVELVVSHDAYDAERIKAILDASAPSLREGIL